MRVFKTGITPTQGEIVIDGDDARHLGLALRVKPGERVDVCDGERGVFECAVKSVSKNAVTLEICGFSRDESESDVNTTLFVAIPKADQMDSVLRQSVELGVIAIVPVITERTVVKPSASHVPKWQKTVYGAACQSERGRLPIVENIIKFDEMLTRTGQYNIFITAYEREAPESALRPCVEGQHAANVALFVGPEGGLSGGEIASLRTAGSALVSLGRRVLRVSTAVCAALAVINEYSESTQKA